MTNHTITRNMWKELIRGKVVKLDDENQIVLEGIGLINMCQDIIDFRVEQHIDEMNEIPLPISSQEIK